MSDHLVVYAPHLQELADALDALPDRGEGIPIGLGGSLQRLINAAHQLIEDSSVPRGRAKAPDVLAETVVLRRDPSLVLAGGVTLAELRERVLDGMTLGDQRDMVNVIDMLTGALR